MTDTVINYGNRSLMHFPYNVRICTLPIVPVRVYPSYQLFTHRRFRNFPNVLANLACFTVLGEYRPGFFVTALANADVDLPAFFAFARNAPGRLIAPLIQFLAI